MSKVLDLDGAGFLLLAQHTNATSTCPMNSNQDSICSSNAHLWAIALLLPDAKYCIIARFRNRQDTDDYARFLQRTVPGGKFEVMFFPGETQV